MDDNGTERAKMIGSALAPFPRSGAEFLP